MFCGAREAGGGSTIPAAHSKLKSVGTDFVGRGWGMDLRQQGQTAFAAAGLIVLPLQQCGRFAVGFDAASDLVRQQDGFTLCCLEQQQEA